MILKKIPKEKTEKNKNSQLQNMNHFPEVELFNLFFFFFSDPFVGQVSLQLTKVRKVCSLMENM